MKKIIYISILTIALGCSDKLDQDNPNQLASNEYYQTEEQAISGIDALYNSLIIDGAYNRMTPVMNDGRSDEIIARSPWPVLTSVSTFSLTADNAFNRVVWEAYYQLIYRANQVFEGVPGIKMNENLKNRVLGQAYFLRALAYFNLTTFYDEVPIITKVPKSPAEYYPATSRKEEIWNLIKSDLNMAKDLLPVSYNDVSGPDRGQNGRATKGAALALLGKTFLFTKDYQNAATQFEAVIALNRYKLASNYKDNFTNDPAVEQSNPESIFAIEFTNSNAPVLNWGDVPNANWRQFLAVSPTYGAPDKGFFDFYPSFWLYSEMRAEKTVDNKLDPRFHATFLAYEPAEGYTRSYGQPWPYDPGAFFIKKYTNADLGPVNEFDFTSGINYQVIRYADVLLMYAECQNELDNQAKAAEYIHKVRSRPNLNLPDRQAEFATYTKAQMREQIAHERVMELAIEGSRFQDIKRWGWLYDPAKLEMLKNHDFEFKTYTQGKEYLRIPQGDLDLNPNLAPNSAN